MLACMTGDHGAQPEPEVADELRRWFQSRDRDALDRLLADNLPFLQRYAHGKLPDAQRAKQDTGDLIQEAVVDFMHYTPPFEIATQRQLRGLLCKIVDGVLAGQHRWFARMRRDVARERPLPHGTSIVMQPFVARDPSPSAEVQASELEAQVRLAIATLPPLDQKIVMMRTYQKSSFADIGAEVGMKEDTARVRCARALAALSRKLQALKQGDVDTFLG